MHRRQLMRKLIMMGVDLPYWGIYPGASGATDGGSDATLDNIPSGGIIQVEIWARANAKNKNVIKKGTYNTTGWILQPGYFQIMTVGGMIQATFNPTIGVMNHILGHYDDSTKKARMAVNGVWGTETVAGAGNYVSDAADVINVGTINADIIFGWARIHNHAHYTSGTDFSVPTKIFPGTDANTVEAWAFNEGYGTVSVASVNSPANNVALTNCEWKKWG